MTKKKGLLPLNTSYSNISEMCSYNDTLDQFMQLQPISQKTKSANSSIKIKIVSILERFFFSFTCLVPDNSQRN